MGRYYNYEQEDDISQEYRERAKLFGRTDHQEINRIKSRISDAIVGLASDYVVLFTEDDDRTLDAPGLLVNGLIMRGRPDLVLHNPKKKHSIIVERKTTRKRTVIDDYKLTRGAWKNIQCQLWAYSYLSPWQKEQRISLVAEIWRYHQDFLCPAIDPFIWHKGDESHETDCLQYFRMYEAFCRQPSR